MVLWTFSRSSLGKLGRLKKSINQIAATSTTSSTRSPSALFLECPLEVPIIAVTDSKNVDFIGPPHPVSNLRPIVRRRRENETELQQSLRTLQDATQEWNQNFWVEHNTRFIQERKQFVMNKQREKGSTETLTAEEMSEFYKEFLDANWSSHMQYNVAWYKRNFHILLLSLWAALPASFH